MSGRQTFARVLIGVALVTAEVVVLPFAGDRFSSPVQAASSMTVVKSASPASGSTVRKGDAITYTVAVTNTGTEPLTALQVADTLPAGVTNVPGSSKISGARTLVQYLDRFDAQAYNNTNGATNWAATPWVETVDGGSPTGGDIEIKDDNDPSPARVNVLYIKGEDGRSISRPINLAGCATGTPTLSFEWRLKDDLTGGKEVYLDLYNGTSWVQQAVFAGSKTTGYAIYTQTIPAQFRVAGAQLRFRSSITNDKLLYVDNVKIDRLCDVITPLTNAGTPPTLVATTNGYGIAAGETATITFQATVDGTNQVVANTATVTTDQVPATTSNAVTHNVEVATITKSASPASGSNVVQGSTITYTVAIKNTGALPLTALQVADTLPAGVTYVPGSSKISGARTMVQYLDQFNAQAYNNTNGTTNWATPWEETLDGGSPTGGDIEIKSDTADGNSRVNVLYVKGKDGRSIRRPINLAGCASGTPTLSFEWRRKDDLTGGKEVYLDLSFDGGANWAQQAVFSGTATATYTTYTQTIPAAFRVAGAQLRFRSSITNDKLLYVDNVKVEGLCDVITPLTNAGAPPTLVVTTGNYGIAPGETATVTFQATVNTLGVGVTTLVLNNTATAALAGVPTITSNTVTHTVVSLPSFKGTVYFDKDNSGGLNAGDPAIGAPIWAKLVNSGGTAVKAAAVDTVTGAYTITLVPAGTYTVIIDDNDNLADTTPTAPTTWSNATPATGSRSGVVSGGDGASDVTGLHFGLTRSADLELTKTVSATTAYVGGSVAYTLSLKNNGPQPTANVVVTDLLPAGLTYVSQGGTGSYVPATGKWTVPNVANGQTVTLTILASVSGPLTVNMVVTNAAEVTDSLSRDPDSTPANGSTTEDDDDTAAFTVVAPPTAEVAVTKTVDVANAGVGDIVAYTITVKNNGPDAISGGVLNDVLPASLGFQTYSTTPIGSGVYNPTTGTWNFGSLANGQTRTLRINAKVLTVGSPSQPVSVTNTASVDIAPVIDPTPGNNTASATFGVPLADLSVVKKIDGQDHLTAPLLSTHTFTVALTNAGPNTANDVVVDDLLPSGFLLQSANATSGTYDQGLWTISSMPVGTQTLSMVVVLASMGQLSNTAELVSVSGIDPDSTPGNDNFAEDDIDRVTVTVTNSAGEVAVGLPGGVCFAVADNGSPVTSGGDLLTRVNNDTGAVEAVSVGSAGTGTVDIESMAVDPVTGVIYTANAGNFGSLDRITGAFTSIGPAAIGTGFGFATVGATATSQLPFNDIDGLAFDPTSGLLYAAVRRAGTPEDLLIRIDPMTGTYVQNAFDTDANTNTREDFVIIRSVTSGGAVRNDIDDLAVDLDGTLYGIANSDGTGDQVLIRINKLTGTTTIFGVLYRPAPNQNIKMTDVEGLSFDLQGQLYATTGANGLDPGGIYRLDKTPVSGRINALAYQPLGIGSDYEAVACGVPATDVAVTKAVSNGTPTAGSNITYTIRVTDNGPTIATGIRVDDVLPTGLTYVSHTASLGVYTSGTGAWNIGGLLPGATATLTIVATVGAGVPRGTPIVNTAAIPNRLPNIAWVDQPDSDPTNNSDTAEIVVGITPADIRGTVFDDLDGDGSISSGDGTIAGVLIELFRDANDDGIPDGPAVATTRTLGDGTYVFENLPNGTYLVVETDPTSHASVSDVFGLNDNKIKVVLDGYGVDSNGNDFLDVALDYGDAPATYGTASAKISPSLRLGAGVTPDQDGRYDNADSDDGVNFDNAVVTTSGYTLDVGVTNTTGASVWVCGWIDTDSSGVFDPAERQCDEVLAGESTANLTWTGVGGLNGTSFSRFRVAPTLLQAQAATGTPGIGEVEDYPIDLATLPVTVAYFSSKVAAGDIDVTWWSGTETGNVGYVVYGESSEGELIALTGLVLGAGDSLTPLEYTQTVPGAYDTLWLADVDLTGEETLHGPYEVGRAVGTVPVPVPLGWESAQAVAETAEQAADAVRSEQQSREIAESAERAEAIAAYNAIGTGSSIASIESIGSGQAAALRVERAGLHRVTFEQMLAAGLDWTGVEMRDLAVTDSNGEPVPYRKTAGTAFGPGSSVVFWGEPLDTLYTGTNVYHLVVDRSLRLRVRKDRSRVPKRNVDTATSYVHTVVAAEQNLYSVSAPGDDPWYGFNMFSFGLPQETIVELDHVESGPGSVSVKMWGVFDFAPIDDHLVSVAVNGVDIGEVEFGGTSAAVIDASVPDGLLVEGANTVTITVHLVPGMPYDWVNLDEVAVSYPRRIVAVDGTANFTASADRIVVAGLESRNVRILRFDRAGVARVARSKAFLQPDGTYEIAFAGTGAQATYAVTQLGGAAVADIAPARAATGLLDGEADLLIISHSAFSDHLGDLVAARQAQGLDVKVVEVEDVYAAYTGEVFDPAAISAYIADAALAFGDPAVLLVGADSYDYRDYSGTGSMSFIPTIYGDVGIGGIAWSPIDPAFVDLDHDQVPDLALGRFPVRDLDELSNAIDKAITYTPDTTALFSSDTGYGRTTDEVASLLPAGYDVTTAHLDDLAVADARKVLLGGLDNGAGLTVFFGHSSTDQWTAEGLLTTSDVAAMTNTDDPTLVVQFGCWNTYFSDPAQQSLGSALVTSPAGGAAVLGATTLTSEVHDAMFSRHMMDAFTSSDTIGAALRTAKRNLNSAVSAPDITLGWTLLGDPTIPLN